MCTNTTIMCAHIIDSENYMHNIMIISYLLDMFILLSKILAG